MKKRLAKFWVVIPLLIIVVSGIVASQLIVNSKPAVVECTGENAENFSCWQSHYKTIVQNDSPEKAFEDFRTIYESSSYIKSNCHQVAHVIGREAAKKYPSLAETYSHGDNFCWSGYYHGAIETVAAKLGKEKILTQINTVCASFLQKEKYSFDHYNCVHGMGHGLMAVLDDDLYKALESCEKFSGDWQQQSCYSGVFMENVMNEISGGGRKAYFKADDPMYPCTEVADKYKNDCYMMQTSHALSVVGYDYAKIFKLCSEVEAPYNSTCYLSLGRDVSGQSSSDAPKTVSLCMLGETFEAKDNCFTGAVKDFISYYHNDDEGLAMCKQIPDPQLSKNCTEQATVYFRSF